MVFIKFFYVPQFLFKKNCITIAPEHKRYNEYLSGHKFDCFVYCVILLQFDHKPK